MNIESRPRRSTADWVKLSSYPAALVGAVVTFLLSRPALAWALPPGGAYYDLYCSVASVVFAAVGALLVYSVFAEFHKIARLGWAEYRLEGEREAWSRDLERDREAGAMRRARPRVLEFSIFSFVAGAIFAKIFL